MSDQSQNNGTDLSTNTDAPAAPVVKTWAEMDLIEKIDDLNARLSAVGVSSGGISDPQLAMLKRLARTVFGDEIE